MSNNLFAQLEFTVMIKPSVGQIDDLMSELNEVIERGERAIVTLTGKMAEDLTHYLRNMALKLCIA